MTIFDDGVFRFLRLYSNRYTTMRNEIRTERFINSLPEEIRHDIGWPDVYAERRSRRR
ncbi:MAG: hypothetical protein ACRECW_06735 [Phyllobacterium sp.]